MPTLSKEKKDKISEQILHHLFAISPESKFTSEIAREIARDEEFTKTLLSDLQKKKLINEINLNKQGIKYERRQRWRLSNQAHDVYLRHQNQKMNFQPSSNISEMQ